MVIIIYRTILPHTIQLKENIEDTLNKHDVRKSHVI